MSAVSTSRADGAEAGSAESAAVALLPLIGVAVTPAGSDDTVLVRFGVTADEAVRLLGEPDARGVEDVDEQAADAPARALELHYFGGRLRLRGDSARPDAAIDYAEALAPESDGPAAAPLEVSILDVDPFALPAQELLAHLAEHNGDAPVDDHAAPQHCVFTGIDVVVHRTRSIADLIDELDEASESDPAVDASAWEALARRYRSFRVVGIGSPGRFEDAAG